MEISYTARETRMQAADQRSRQRSLPFCKALPRQTLNKHRRYETPQL